MRVAELLLIILRKAEILNLQWTDNVDLKAVQELLGHKRIRMTLRYSHLSETHKEKAVATLDHVWTEKTNFTKTIQSAEQKECLSAVSH